VVTGIAEGICTVAADQAGNDAYGAAARTSRDIGVSVVGATPRTIAWSAAVSGNWSDSTKWTGGVVPTAADDVVITMAGTYTITLDTNPTVNSLTIGEASGSQTLTGVEKTLNINTATIVNAKGVIDLGGGVLNLNDASTLAGTIKNGTVTSTTLTSNSGTLDGVTVGSSMTIGGTLHIANGITLADGVTVNAGATVMGFSGTNKSVSTTGNATIISSGGDIYPSEDTDNATLILGPGITWSGCPGFKKKPIGTSICCWSATYSGSGGCGLCPQD
jgi:hypothetical protein